MKVLDKFFGIIIIGSILLMISGCSSFIYFRERALSIDDIINMSKANAGKDIIIRQIEVTHSKFRLETADIIRLKNENVDDEVIEYMIASDFTPDAFSWEYGYRPYDYWYYHYDNYYYPPYYPVYDYNYYYSPFWDGLRGVPQYRYRSPYSYPVNILTDFYRQRSLFYDGDYYSRDRSPMRRPDERRPMEYEKPVEK